MMKLCYALLVMLFMIPLVGAIPSAPSASNITSNSVTLTATGCSGSSAWFSFGMATGQTYSAFPNVTPVAGTATYWWHGFPLGLNGQTYYVVACDPTGCSAQTSFQTLTVTPAPTTTFGVLAENLTESGFDPSILVYDAFWAFVPTGVEGGQSIIMAIILFGLFVGIWLRTRGTLIAQIFGWLTGWIFISASAGLLMGVPPEFQAAAQALAYACLAGTLLMWTFK